MIEEVPTSFPVTILDNDIRLLPEQLGTKEKFWLLRNDQRYLFKIGRPGTGENWAEKIAADRSPPAAKIWLDQLRQISENGCQNQFQRLPVDQVTPLAKEFALTLLALNKKRLLEQER